MLTASTIESGQSIKGKSFLAFIKINSILLSCPSFVKTESKKVKFNINLENIVLNN